MSKQRRWRKRPHEQTFKTKKAMKGFRDMFKASTRATEQIKSFYDALSSFGKCLEAVRQYYRQLKIMGSK